MTSSSRVEPWRVGRTLGGGIAAALVWSVLTTHLAGELRDQTERVVNVEARIDEVMRRQDKIDTTNQYVMIGLFGNLLAHILHVKVTRDTGKRRRSSDLQLE